MSKECNDGSHLNPVDSLCNDGRGSGVSSVPASLESSTSLDSETKRYSIKAVVTVACLMPPLLLILHFCAAVFRIEFSAVRETETLIACLGILSLVATFAFKK